MRRRLLLVDDHPVLTRGLAGLINQEPDLEVSGQFATGEELLAVLEASPDLPGDLLVLDLHLPTPHDGLSLLLRLRRGWPALRVLVFSTVSSPLLVSQVAAAGAHGFLDKSAEAGALLAAIRAVCTGLVVFPARLRMRGTAPGPPPETEPDRLAADVLLRLRQLSKREREVIACVRDGLATRAIAERLELSEFTVSTHRRNVMKKLGVNGMADLVRFAHEHGL